MRFGHSQPERPTQYVISRLLFNGTKQIQCQVFTWKLGLFCLLIDCDFFVRLYFKYTFYELKEAEYMGKVPMHRRMRVALRFWERVCVSVNLLVYNLSFSLSLLFCVFFGGFWFSVWQILYKIEEFFRHYYHIPNHIECFICLLIIGHIWVDLFDRCMCTFNPIYAFIHT